MRAELEQAVESEEGFRIHVEQLGTVVVKFSLHYCVTQRCGKIERVEA